MRLLFAHPQIFLPGNHRGALKSFRALIVALSARGHECEVVTMDGGAEADIPAWQRLATSVRALENPDVRVAVSNSVDKFRSAPTSLGALCTDLHFLAFVRRRALAFQPDWVFCENGWLDLRVILPLFPDRLVVRVATTSSLPFGPRRSNRYPSLSAPWIYPRIPKIHSISRYVQKYMREHANLDSVVQPQLSYGNGPFETSARFADGVITMINPTAHKGGALFLELARDFPNERFRGVQTYGDIIPELRRLPNVEIVPADDDVGRVLRGSKVLLVPSQWGEAWGMVSVDAMLRGIPVLASDDGGLPESTLGVGQCIAVKPGRITRYTRGDVRFRAQPLDPAPWRRALRDLIGSAVTWEKRSVASKAAALEYVRGLSIDPLCEYLNS